MRVFIKVRIIYNRVFQKNRYLYRQYTNVKTFLFFLRTFSMAKSLILTNPHIFMDFKRCLLKLQCVKTFVRHRHDLV